MTHLSHLKKKPHLSYKKYSCVSFFLPIEILIWCVNSLFMFLNCISAYQNMLSQCIAQI